MNFSTFKSQITDQEVISALNKNTGRSFLMKIVLFANKYPYLRDIIKEYLKLNPTEVNKAYGFGWTALHYMAYDYNPDIETVNILLDNGADIDAKTFFGHSAAQISFTKNNYELFKLLCNKGANIERDFVSKCKPLCNISWHLLKLLIEYDFIVDSSDVPKLLVKEFGAQVNSIVILNVKN